MRLQRGYWARESPRHHRQEREDELFFFSLRFVSFRFVWVERNNLYYSSIVLYPIVSYVPIPVKGFFKRLNLNYSLHLVMTPVYMFGVQADFVISRTIVRLGNLPLFILPSGIMKQQPGNII